VKVYQSGGSSSAGHSHPLLLLLDVYGLYCPPVQAITGYWNRRTMEAMYIKKKRQSMKA